MGVLQSCLLVPIVAVRANAGVVVEKSFIRGWEQRVEWEDKSFELEQAPYSAIASVKSLEIECRDCFYDAEPDQWEIEDTSDFEKDEDRDYWEVRCASCDHEIEFGWSHPDREGRIWPALRLDVAPNEIIDREETVLDIDLGTDDMGQRR